MGSEGIDKAPFNGKAGPASRMPIRSQAAVTAKGSRRKVAITSAPKCAVCGPGTTCASERA